MTQILISSSVLILVLALLRQVLRGKVSFCLQYALWLLVAFRLLLPFQIGHSAYSVTSLSSAQTQAAQSFLERPFTQSAAPLQKLTAPVSPTPAAQQITQPVTRPVLRQTATTMKATNLNCESGAALTKEALYTSVFDSNRAYEQRLELTLSTYFAKELREILLASPDAKITEFWLSPELAKELQDALLDSPETLPLELVIDAFYETVYYDNMNAAQLWLDENGDLWCCAMVYLPQGGAQEREPCLTGPTGEERYDASVLPRVIELYSAERGHHESDGTPYRLHIPFLLVSGDYANEVNGEILRTFLREDVYSAEYTWAVNGDILSIAVSGESDGKVSRSANIDLRDGTPASQEAG